MGFADFMMTDSYYQADRNKNRKTNTTPTTPAATPSATAATTSTGRETKSTTPTVVEQSAPSWIPTGPAGYSGGSSSSSKDTTDYINELKQAQIKANIASLDKQLSNSLSNLDSQQSSIKDTYYGKRNQAAAASDVAAMNFAQRAAARGLTGNAASMPEIYRNSALQGQIGALDQAEAAANAGIESNRTNLKNNYESDVAAAQAGAEATALQNFINQMNTDKQTALQEAELTGTYQGASTLAGQAQILANKKAQLENYAQEIANSYLPYTYKKQAELLQQQVESGRVDIDTALAQLAEIRSGN